MNSIRSLPQIALATVALAGWVFDSAANEPANEPGTPPKNSLTENTRLQQLLAEANRSSGPEEIIRLASAGADSSVIQTYVENSGRRYDLDADQIIQLHQRGVSPGIISAMIRRGASNANQSPDPAPAPVSTIVIQAEAPAPQPASTVTYIHNTQPRYYGSMYRPLYVSAYPYASCGSGYYGYGGFGSCYYRASYWNYRPAWTSDFRYRICW